ncbi:MAG: TetR/AcrR family transcriptional regulator [Proteobacteria bacterium]|nr:TetR/AcrR family transcriptional regulator [Pseudomonadota bacterium]
MTVPGAPDHVNDALPTFEERPLALVRAAFDLVAEGGLERLRTRDVAARAGVNIATLHYYFATKEKLIEGVALYLASLFGSIRAPMVEAAEPNALDRLRQEFADARLYFDAQPQMVTVMQELVLRSRRDPAVAQVVDPLRRFWKLSVEETLALGVREGAFRPDLSPPLASGVIVAALWGAATLPLAHEEREAVYRAIEQWIVAPPQSQSSMGAGHDAP